MNEVVAYFSMEIGLTPYIPTYSGGLGVLAGDTIKSFADLAVPAVAITLLHRKGYFYQEIDNDGNQHEEPYNWTIEKYLKKRSERVKVQIEDRTITLAVWEYQKRGERGHIVPVYFLDANLEENSEWDRHLTDHLYGGDRYYRFCQEVILGIGGMRMLDALGYSEILKYHLNEGHAALATVELLHRNNMDVDRVKEKCVFTTHTPVAAGHDTFDISMVGKIIKDYYPWHTKLAEHDGKFNMTYLALNLSAYVNGVAKKHKEVSMHMFPGREIHSITNGIHTASWCSPNMAFVLSKHIPDWKHDPFSLRAALSIPDDEIWQAHIANKKDLFAQIKNKWNIDLDPEVFTVGFARRSTAYKRPDLLFHDVEWLKAIAEKHGKMQLLFAGKAHTNDGAGKEIIKKLYWIKNTLGDKIKLVYLPNYDIALAKKLIAGVDIWLNTPRRPMEASGTSGMKATLNGVPQFSVLDGWWLEGHIEGLTGWSIGPRDCNESDDAIDSKDLYEKLEKHILPTFYQNRPRWMTMMKHSIAMNGSFFHTHRMVQQYVTNAYFK